MEQLVLLRSCRVFGWGEVVGTIGKAPRVRGSISCTRVAGSTRTQITHITYSRTHLGEAPVGGAAKELGGVREGVDRQVGGAVGAPAGVCFGGVSEAVAGGRQMACT